MPGPIDAIPVAGAPAAPPPPPARPSAWPKVAVAALALLVIAAAGTLLFVLLRPGPEGNSAKQIEACRNKVKTQLKAPATARFSEESVGRQPTGDLYEVHGLVDAQNGFGALLRERYTCTVTADGQALSVTLSAWN